MFSIHLSVILVCLFFLALSLTFFFSVSRKICTHALVCVYRYVYICKDAQHDDETHNVELDTSLLTCISIPTLTQDLSLTVLAQHNCTTTYIHAQIELSKHITSANHICMYVRICTCVYINIYINMYICIYMFAIYIIYINIHIQRHKHIHDAHAYIYIHIYIHIYIYRYRNLPIRLGFGA